MPLATLGAFRHLPPREVFELSESELLGEGIGSRPCRGRSRPVRGGLSALPRLPSPLRSPLPLHVSQRKLLRRHLAEAHQIRDGTILGPGVCMRPHVVGAGVQRSGREIHEGPSVVVDDAVPLPVSPLDEIDGFLGRLAGSVSLSLASIFPYRPLA